MGKTLTSPEAHTHPAATGVVRVAAVRFAVALPNGDVLVPRGAPAERVTTGVRPKSRDGR